MKPDTSANRTQQTIANLIEPQETETSVIVEALSEEAPTLPKVEETIETTEVIESSTSTVEEWESLSESCIFLSEGLARIPIAKKGTFHHKKHGLVTFNDEDFNSIKANFSERTLGFDPYPTFGHIVDDAVTTTSQYIDSAQKAVDSELKKGQVLGIEQEGDILYAITKPNPDALGHILSNEYEYSSGEFLRDYRDKITNENRGTVLARFALTNSPFIPFEDSKIEVFSDNGDQIRPQTLQHFVVKLSSNVELDNSEQSPMPQDIKEGESITVDPSTSLTAEATVETLPSQTNSLSAVVDQITSTVKDLYEKKYAEVEERYDSAKAQYESHVASLKVELEKIQSQFAAQEAVTQKFSLSLSEAEKSSKYKELATKGVSPALIQKFSLIEEAVESNSKVIKLSDSEGNTVESGLLDLIESLLIDSVNSDRPVVEQLGQSLNETNFSADLKRIANEFRAKKQSLI